MIRKNLEAIAGIEIYPVISLTIFFVLFTLMLIWVFRSDKKHIARMSGMPLEDDYNTITSNKLQKGDHNYAAN